MATAQPTDFMASRGLDRERLTQLHPHGTRVRYVCGCKCMLCRAANSRYETERLAARKRGETNRIVSSEVVVTHLRKLSRLGIGRRAIAAASGVSETNIQKLRNGQRPNVREATARRILAVDHTALSDHALVPARQTVRLFDRLLEEGYTKTTIAKALGAKMNRKATKTGEAGAEFANLQAARRPSGRCLAKTALKVRRLYNRLVEVPA
jgi:transcriptional regulator with XRE-family HTH domain